MNEWMANYVHTYVVTVVQYVNESTPRHILRGSATVLSISWGEDTTGAVNNS